MEPTGIEEANEDCTNNRVVTYFETHDIFRGGVRSGWGTSPFVCPLPTSHLPSTSNIMVEASFHLCKLMMLR